MERYLWVNPDRLRNATRHVEGMDFVVSLSPYDTPKAIVGKYVPDSGEFAIAFEYIDDEKPVVSRIQRMESNCFMGNTAESS